MNEPSFSGMTIDDDITPQTLLSSVVKLFASVWGFLQSEMN